jgi:hypothetical protein
MTDSAITVDCVKGAIGSVGPTGDKGPVGDKGTTGDKGGVGDTGSNPIRPRTEMVKLSSDCVLAGVSTISNEMLGVAVSSGTLTTVTTVANHPGMVRYCNTTTAYTGYYIGTDSAILIAGGEVFETVIYIPDATNTYCYLGFHDKIVSGAGAGPANGLYFSIQGTSVYGMCTQASSTSWTASPYTITAATWYRLKLVVNADATRVDFYIYTADGTQVWTGYLTDVSRFPIVAVKVNLFAYGTAAANQHYLLYLDWFRTYCTRTLVR